MGLLYVFLNNWLCIDSMLVVRNLDDGHSGGRNKSMKNSDMIEHIYKRAFVGLSYNYRICFNGQKWNIQSSVEFLGTCIKLLDFERET